MSEGSKGLLLVLADPPAPLEEEFNDWYDTEHLPERRCVPGFETALRFKSVGDGPAYAAIYDLQSLDVLQSEPYLAVSAANFSPWTRRVTARSRTVRITARQISPAQRSTGRCARLMLMRIRQMADAEPGSVAQRLRDGFSRQGLIQLRMFACEEPAADAMLAVAEFDGLAGRIDPVEAFGPHGNRVDFIGSYRPYAVSP